MDQLFLLPENSSELLISASARGSRLKSPATFFGLIESEQPRILSARWSSLSSSEYAYLMAFYRTGAKSNALEFLIDLPIRSATYESCRAKFVGGLTVGDFTGSTASVEGQLVVIPRGVKYPLSAAADALTDQVTTEVPS